MSRELMVAEFHPKSVILLKQLGVGKVFPFVLPPVQRDRRCENVGDCSGRISR
ncbi:MAG: hypothetical protein L6W00_11195 [Lentisphaeria bacterium]|nr:MAG: hypothetical protein L6W00_11195 [Lentisphaeria bacterium]